MKIERRNKFKKIERILNGLLVEGFSITDDFIVNVNESVEINGTLSGRTLPVRFGVIKGDFLCGNNFLTDLKNCPTIIEGNFNCDYNNIRNLRFFPDIIQGGFSCIGNRIESLQGMTQTELNYFDCSHNNLKSLQFSPSKIWDCFNCSYNQLQSLEFGPEYALRYFCDGNNLKNLNGSPKIIKGFLSCNENQLENVDGLFPDINLNVPQQMRGNIISYDMIFNYQRKRKFELLTQ
jgi:hypothetical protein